MVKSPERMTPGKAIKWILNRMAEKGDCEAQIVLTAFEEWLNQFEEYTLTNTEFSQYCFIDIGISESEMPTIHKKG